MMIHIVQPEETIDAIATMYHISTARLIEDNGLSSPRNLIPGQAIVIVYPQETYVIQEGDSLDSIAQAHGTTVLKLLRNNPYLLSREYIYPGETIVISYQQEKGKVTTVGYANPFINRDILQNTLPYLTYLSVFGNRNVGNGEIESVDDTEIIQMAKEYGVAPLMFLSTINQQGTSNYEAAFNILYNEEYINRYIDNILGLLKKKGYYGLNITYQFLSSYNLNEYNNFTTQLVDRLHEAGFPVFIALTPVFTYSATLDEFDRIDYSYIGQKVDGVMLTPLNFASSYGPPAPVISYQLVKSFLNYAVSLIPREKILTGFTVIGYDWQLPYVSGVTKANSLTYDSAIALAGEVGASIQFDETSQTPFYEYTDYGAGVPLQHIVWFVDARSIDAITSLIEEYEIQGINIWNIMYYFTQLWLIINSQFEIIQVLD